MRNPEAALLVEGEVDRVLPVPQEPAVLAVRDLGWGRPSTVRAFDTAGFGAAGPEITVEGPVCLALIPDGRGETRAVVVEHGPRAVRTRDPFTGALMSEVPPAVEEFDDVLAIAVGWPAGAPAVFSFGELHANRFGWRARDLRTGRKVDRLGDDGYGWFILEAAAEVVSDVLVVPAQTTRIEEDGDIQEGRLDVFRLGAGSRCGSLDHSGPADFSAAVVYGRPLLATDDGIYGLPGLEKIASRPRGWTGGPCALGESDEVGVIVTCRSPLEGDSAAVWALADPLQPLGELEAPWTGRTYDLAVAADGMLFAATSSGLYGVPMAEFR